MNRFSLFHISKFILYFLITVFSYNVSLAQGFEGYYQNPNIHNNRIVFVAEGDLWTVPLSGGLAQRITSHPEEENFPSISPDGKTIAFSASYEGPLEVYTMPVEGGIPKRWTYEQDASITNSWTPDGKVIYNTRAYSKVPDNQIITIDLLTKQKTKIPLAQASEAAYDVSGKTVYFVRPAYHRNVTKRYKGGTARQIWKFTQGANEAVKLTKDYLGGSHHPMWFSGRIYFITDRDGIKNIWSMNESGEDLQQHTNHKDYDVRSASISNGNIVYQVAADLWHYNTISNESKKINIKLVSDLDQLRENWDDNPSQYITSVHTDSKGEKIVITARGRVFVAPVKSGRFVSFTDKKNVRYRDAVFSHDEEKIYALSDESGEFEFVSLPSNGQGSQKKITSNGELLRYGGLPSSDGKWIAYDDLESNMYVLNIASGVSKKISTNQEGILDCNLLVGYVWADTKRATASSVVTCTDKALGSYICKKIASAYWKKRKDLVSDMPSGSIDEALLSLKSEFSIIADSGDNPTAGGVGDRADVLKAFFKESINNSLFAGIASKSAYDELRKGNEFNIGGTFGGGGPELKLKADSVYFKNNCAIVKISKTVVIISKLRRAFHNLQDFSELNINLSDFKVLVVKSGYLSPELQSLSAPSFMALTDGAVNQNLVGIENNNRNQKIYPFQDFDEFIPNISDGEPVISK